MAHLWSVASVLPPYVLTADEARLLGTELFAGTFAGRRATSFAALVDHSLIAERHLCRPVEELLRPRGPEAAATLCHAAARDLGRAALEAALAGAGVAAAEVDALIVATTTGHGVPSLDHVLAAELGLRSTVRRYPFSSFFSLGGAAALVRAADVAAAAGPEATVAIVAVDTPSLLFRPADRSMANAVSAALFGDGAAAAVLRGARPPRPALALRATRSWTVPGTTGAMGLRPVADGFQAVLAAEVPALGGRGLAAHVDALAAAAGARRNDLGFFVVHPGGRRILETLEAALDLPPSATATAREVLRRCGNMTGPTILFVLEEQLRRGLPPAGALGLALGLGPGLSGEAAVLEVVA